MNKKKDMCSNQNELIYENHRVLSGIRSIYFLFDLIYKVCTAYRHDRYINLRIERRHGTRTNWISLIVHVQFNSSLFTVIFPSEISLNQEISISNCLNKSTVELSKSIRFRIYIDIHRFLNSENHQKRCYWPLKRQIGNWIFLQLKIMEKSNKMN